MWATSLFSHDKNCIYPFGIVRACYPSLRASAGCPAALLGRSFFRITISSLLVAYCISSFIRAVTPRCASRPVGFSAFRSKCRLALPNLFLPGGRRIRPARRLGRSYILLCSVFKVQAELLLAVTAQA